MNLKEKELEILRQAVDKAETIQQKQQVKSPELKQIIQIVEDFLRNKKLVCYKVQLLIIYYQFMTNFMINQLKYLIMIFIVIMHLNMLKN